MASSTSVEDWLRSLGLLSYTEAFIDNGYDDLDICKQIGDEDLDAIGVINAKDRRDILNSVKLLRDKGVNAVYFQLEDEQASKPNVWPSADREKYRREDLIEKLKQLLIEDNCVLPENIPNPERDPLDDLAQYYADQLYTYVQDVKEVLEYLRDGESNEGTSVHSHTTPKESKKQIPNEKLVKDSRLSKSLNSIDSASVKTKAPKSPKHGISRLFGRKNKNYVQQPPLIKGPTETAAIGIGLANQVKMSDEGRKSLMLQVKHGDITQEEALNNFLFYEAAHTPLAKEQDKNLETKQKKKKSGLFSRSSFKRHSSGSASANSCEVLASDINVGEMERMELMRKIKNKEISNEDAWECLRKFGSKRDSKASKSPKLHRRGSKSPKDRISASSFHIGPKFYTDTAIDISQSTSNIPARTASMDSSPDSTPALYRKLDSIQCNNSSSEQLGSSGSIDTVDPKGNYSQPRHTPPPVSKRTPSPLTHADLRRTVSAKDGNGNGQKEKKELKRRSTVGSSDPSLNRSSPPKPARTSVSDSSPTIPHRPIPAPPSTHPPAPPKKPPKLPPKLPPNKPVPANKPTLAQLSEQQNEPPKLPKKPVLPEKPVLRQKPPLKAKPYYNLTIPPKSPDGVHGEENEEKTDEKVHLVNGTENLVTSSEGLVTSNEVIGGRKPSIPPARPSPLTRVSSHKPSGHCLLEIIEAKLKEEEIDLIQEPYTVEEGEWGVPMNLVERYSCELNSTMREVTKEIDHIRIEKLNQAQKIAAPCDIANLRFVLDVVGKLSSMADWLTSLGLPMYIENLMEAGYDDINEVPYLNDEHLEHANITNPDHIYRLTRSLENMTPLDTSTIEPNVGD